MAENLRRNCLSILRTGQSPAGGWGPYVTAAPQVFDTAMAVLALSSLEVEPRLARSAYRVEELKEAIANGKKYIVSQQKADGSWPETTRPANQESYAQRISTTGWAMLASTIEVLRGVEVLGSWAVLGFVLIKTSKASRPHGLTRNGISVFSGSSLLSVRSN